MLTGLPSRFVLTLSSFAFALAPVLSAQAEPAGPKYPTQPVKIVVGFAAGGGTDVIARMIAQKLQERFDGAFIVENKPGASGKFAPEIVSKATPDGHMLLGAVPGATTVGPAIWSKMSYDPVKDFAPITLVSESPMIVVVPKDHPARTLQELVAWLKANPTKANYPTPSPLFTLAIEHFKIKTQAPGTPITYRSSNDCAISLLGDQTTFGFIETTTAMPLISDGRLRALAVAARTRIPDLPEVPTLAEVGVPDVLASSWFGILATAGTPAPVLKRLETATREIVTSDAFKARLKSMSIIVAGSSADEFATRMAEERKRWMEVAKAVNMTFE